MKWNAVIMPASGPLAVKRRRCTMPGLSVVFIGCGVTFFCLTGSGAGIELIKCAFDFWFFTAIVSSAHAAWWQHLDWSIVIFESRLIFVSSNRTASQVSNCFCFLSTGNASTLIRRVTNDCAVGRVLSYYRIRIRLIK
jgi:hypothetical protein